MKGMLAYSLSLMVKEKLGDDKWKEIIKLTGLDPNTTSFSPLDDIPDDTLYKLMDSTGKILNKTRAEVLDMYGEYFVNVYTFKTYGIYYKLAKNSKEFILKMDYIHQETTKNIKNAHPPRFEYEWKNDKTLIWTYKSSRHMIDYLLSLTKAVGKHYNEKLSISKIGENKIQIIFN